MSSLDFSISEDSVDSAAGLLYHYRNWRRSNPSTEFSSFVAIYPDIAEETLIEIASTDLIHLISQGYDQRAENYIRISSRFESNTEYILDLIDAEICTRSDRGEAVSMESLVERFPRLKSEIERMFDVHSIDLEASSFVGDEGTSKARHIGSYRLDIRLNGSDEDGFELWQASETKSQAKSGKNFTLMIWDVPLGMPKSSLSRALEERKVLKHPDLAELIDFGFLDTGGEEEEVGQVYAVMELISGKTLFDLLDSHWIDQVPEATTIGWIERILGAQKVVAHSGRKPLEISPKDILIDSNEQPKLVDFRLLSPWRANGADLEGDDGTVDQKALRAIGLLIFGICLQETDFEELETQLIAGIEPIKISDVDPSISKELNAVYLSCVHPKAKHRYRSLDQLQDDLIRLKAGKSVKATRIQRRWF